MKNKIEITFFSLLLLCTSCSSIYRFSVDIQEPAKVTLPVYAQNVLILDNTVTQPEDMGIERKFDGEPVIQGGGLSLALDTMVWFAIDEITVVFDESNFFNTIAVYRKPVRNDTEWFSQVELSPELQSELYENEKFNTLLVIDRLLFTFKQDVIRSPNNISSYWFNDIRADGIITCSMYCLGKEKPVTTFSISDSMFYRRAFFNHSITNFKKIPEFVLSNLSYMLGNQVAKRFTPTWKTVDRSFFLGYNSRMQEASGFAANSKWALAEAIWNTELGKKEKPVVKAKISFNLSVANEMQDKFQTALEWAEKAKNYLSNTDAKDYKNEKEIIDKYISDLEIRIKNNLLLDEQWGKE